MVTVFEEKKQITQTYMKIKHLTEVLYPFNKKKKKSKIIGDMLTEYRKNIKESFEHILTDKGSIYIYIYTNQSKNRIRCEIVRTNDDTMGKYEGIGTRS
ncbi:hypothetical protein PFBG_02927 [Plasmodium falciparum 7G8]|uniref:Uncharacterized protein n=1 Tax=Plasmodium falciparum (isolate 7G8) TaxID=57266 RepID=W7F7A7_PLAF8|nr:hypothetical protein PFBG_02927 [Plasmodium falciparum 7G8]